MPQTSPRTPPGVPPALAAPTPPAPTRPVRDRDPLSDRRKPRSDGDELSLMAALIESPDCARFIPGDWFTRPTPRAVHAQLATAGPARAALFAAAARHPGGLRPGMWAALADLAHRTYHVARHDPAVWQPAGEAVGVLTKAQRAVADLPEWAHYGRRIVAAVRRRYADELAGTPGTGTRDA